MSLGVNPLLIIGASARAAAHSALRAGLTPSAIDLFADRDLTACADTRCIAADRYPDGFVERAESFPDGPWMYTGGLENFPDLIDRIAARRPLWGNSGSRLCRVRDPQRVHEALQRAGLPAPAVRDQHDSVPRDGSWLVKPLRSAGGRGIRPWLADSAPFTEDCYFQERVAGRPISAVALGMRTRGALLGITEQRIGRPDSPFAYTGSIGPITLPTQVEALLCQIIDVVAAWSGLIGLFGLDFVLSGEVPYLVEINPRYTASVEILELACRRALLSWHRDACEGRDVAVTRPVPNRVLGKAILFAERPARFSETRGWRPGDRGGFARPAWADVPAPGVSFRAGSPVLTVFADGRQSQEVEERLRRRLAAARRYLDHETIMS